MSLGNKKKKQKQKAKSKSMAQYINVRLEWREEDFCAWTVCEKHYFAATLNAFSDYETFQTFNVFMCCVVVVGDGDLVHSRQLFRQSYPPPVSVSGFIPYFIVLMSFMALLLS